MNIGINSNLGISFCGKYPRKIEGAKIGDLSRAVNAAIKQNGGKQKVTSALLIQNNRGLVGDNGRISKEGAEKIQAEYGTGLFSNFIKSLKSVGQKYPDGDYSRLI